MTSSSQSHPPPPILYHYCTSATFVSIVTGPSIWLSSLSMSNDTLEGRSLGSLIRKLAEADGLPASRVALLVDAAEGLNTSIDGLGLCLSQNGDLLSQWRGYADDGHGFAIGFDTEFLTQLSKKVTNFGNGSLAQVHYEELAQLDACRPMYQKLAEHTTDGFLDKPPNPGSLLTGENIQYEEQMTKYNQGLLSLRASSLLLLGHLYALKTPSFKEELEWRLITHWLPGMPGLAAIKFRSSRDRIIPYVAIDLPFDLGAPAIREVIVGPKNISPEQHIKSLLERNNFKDVAVRRSHATYR